jgi:hypothetical protein
MRHPLILPARDLFLKLSPEARVCLLPLVAGFVGADAVAVALATRIDESPGLRIAVDIGTNGEVLLGSRERLWACSAPAGPALEGAQIRHGMRAAVGAIDRVAVEDGDLRLHTIGDGPAQGLCGSGLVDAVAALLDLGVLDWTGLIDVEGRDRLPAAIRSRVEMRGEERLVVLTRPGEHGAEREITLTQDDVRQVQLCKGAIASGVAMLRHVAGVEPEGIEELMLAGGFGNYLSVRSALRIGLIPPDLPEGKIRYVGNAAALGAQLALVSEAERARAEAIAGRIEHVSLAAHSDFETIFVECIIVPRLPPLPSGVWAGLGAGLACCASPPPSSASPSAPATTRSTRAGSWPTRRRSGRARPRSSTPRDRTACSPTRSFRSATSGRSRWTPGPRPSPTRSRSGASTRPIGSSGTARHGRATVSPPPRPSPCSSRVRPAPTWCCAWRRWTRPDTG